MLFTAEQTNELLLKNHDLKLVGTFIVLEAYVDLNRCSEQFKGRGKKSCHFKRGGNRISQNIRNNP